MATREEKREIAKQFILASPCHELQNVVRDVRVLVADDELIDELLPGVVKEYNMANQVAVDSPYGKRVILARENCVSPDDESCHLFLDPFEGKHFRVTNQVKLVAEEAEEPGATQDAFQKKLQAKLDTYLDDHYRSGTGNVFKGAEAGTYVIAINSEKSNKGSSWSGRWKSRVEVACSGGDAAEGTFTGAAATGLISNAVHYYESGNVQMDTAKQIFKEWADMDTPDKLAHRIVLFIDDAEREFHMKLEEMCQHLSDKSLKTLRRRLPVSKQPFDFSTGAHKLALEISGGMHK
eukprot:TRINITY_DN10540_c0_g1_i2.p1 TRINITY_DN10540_c0_g1~~TRINITY_DN10540_c0_g1_i2.p1  ORF type:complete len:333 (+),score=137.20 TRINITY_DN10540_c0_g1_i2:122-1000(+)